MSWRLILFTLLVLAGIATLGGLKAGDWLTKHSPSHNNVNNASESDPALNSNNASSLPEPPQPLINGTIGLADKDYKTDWQIKAESKEDKMKQISEDPLVPLLESFTSDEKTGNPNQNNQQNSTKNDNSAAASPDPLAALINSSGNTSAPQHNTEEWTTSLSKEMSNCRALKFGERADCIARVRDTFCNANNAWGKVKDCPQ